MSDQEPRFECASFDPVVTDDGSAVVVTCRGTAPDKYVILKMSRGLLERFCKEADRELKLRPKRVPGLS